MKRTNKIAVNKMSRLALAKETVRTLTLPDTSLAVVVGGVTGTHSRYGSCSESK